MGKRGYVLTNARPLLILIKDIRLAAGQKAQPPLVRELSSGTPPSDCSRDESPGSRNILLSKALR
jgi:hypothetical protein